MLAKVHSAATLGIEAYEVEVEVDFSGGLPGYQFVGLPATAVQEGRHRIRAALRNSGLALPAAKVTVNLAPADVRKDGAAFDLPIALGVLVAAGELPAEALDGRLFVGELSLDGAIKPIRGALPITILARRRGYREVFVPTANAAEAALVDGAVVRAPARLAEVVAILRGQMELPPAVAHAPETADGTELDYGDVRGHGKAIRALEVAAAGGHNVLLVGPPGSGKTMLAQRVPSILPPLGTDEALETTCIYSVAGLSAQAGIRRTRPFRAPHHTITTAGLTGGGEAVRPGEVSLAHNGVLFLDELPEFGRACLEALRQPLEDRKLTLVRAKRFVTYPAAFMLIAAMNPCPCGHYGDERRTCTCSEERIDRYRGRISGPLLDRFDMHLWVPVAPYAEIARAEGGECSATVAGRVTAARERQRRRFNKCRGLYVNAQMTPSHLRRFCRVGPDAHSALELHSMHSGISTRAVERVLRVARTIADLRGGSEIGAQDVHEAITMRHLDLPHTPVLEKDYGGGETAVDPVR